MGRIQLDKVTKSFGDVEVIHPLDLTIEDGEFASSSAPRAAASPRCCA
jgi:multiple sugar transport system ATP-binding protein